MPDHREDITSRALTPDSNQNSKAMEDTSNVYCRIFIDVLAELGVGTAVCSPGSRNTPLLLAVAAREARGEGPRGIVVCDERTAGFTALGIAIASRQPVALICTSGTAVLNYAPAVAEAYYQGVPLIVVSADRPEQWIDQDDSQTIRQPGVLANFVKRSYSFPTYAQGDPEGEWYANRMANDAMATALEGKKGPVHINIALAPPLGATDSHPARMQRLICVDTPMPALPRRLMDELCEEALGSRILLVAGFMPPDNALNDAAARLASIPNVAVMAETISNLHLKGDVTSVDITLTHTPAEELDSLAPDLVISIGGALVSRKLKEYLRRVQPRAHWNVGRSHCVADCFKCLTRRVETNPALFLRQLAGMMRHRGRARHDASDYSARWLGARLRSRAAHEAFVKAAPWSEITLFNTLSRRMPQGANLFLSNGTSVRYALLFDWRIHAAYCNRGVSGIDGCTSTAIGAALEYAGMTVLVTGDMSMTYDLGAFATRLMPQRMRIVVISNGGGSIFRFIAPTRDAEAREKYFCADPKLPVKGICAAYGIRYFSASSQPELEATLSAFLNPLAGAAVLEIKVDPMQSSGILTEYMEGKATPTLNTLK